MENIDKIRAACIAANPEIVEPKYGCEVRGMSGALGKTFLIQKFEDAAGGWIEVYPEVWEPFTDRPIYSVGWRGSSAPKFEFYGRPIRLSDVLLAIEYKTRPPEKYMVSTNGIITFRESKEITAQVLNSRFLSTGVSWNLKDDNLENQSKECIEFLSELLN